MFKRPCLRILLPTIAAVLVALGVYETRAAGLESPVSARRAGGPLAAWMSGNATPALAKADYAKLGRAFEHIAQFSPEQPGFERWVPIARAGAAAAGRNDLDSARRACKECHDTMRADYKKKFHDRPLPR